MAGKRKAKRQQATATDGGVKHVSAKREKRAAGKGEKYAKAAAAAAAAAAADIPAGIVAAAATIARAEELEEVVDDDYEDATAADSEDSEESDGSEIGDGGLDLDRQLAEEDISSDSEEEETEKNDEEPAPASHKGKGKAKVPGKSAAAAAKPRGKGSGKATVQVSFDFCDPNERYFYGIKALLAPLLPPEWTVGASELTDLVVAQGAVGTVVTGGNDRDDGPDPDGSVFAFATALPLQFHTDKPGVAALASALLTVAAAAGKKEEMEALLAPSKRAGLVLHGRMLNVPLPVVPRMHESLCDDVAWAVDNEISQEHKDKFKFDSLILLAPCEFIGNNGGARSGGGGKRKGGKPAKGKSPAAPALAMLATELFYTRFEDEILVGEADFWFAAPVAAAGGGNSSSRAGSGSQYLVVAGLPADALLRCVPQIEALVGPG